METLIYIVYLVGVNILRSLFPMLASPLLNIEKNVYLDSQYFFDRELST